MNDRDDSAEQWVVLNGRIMPLNQAWISPLDRGFLYGDGLFTTVRVELGRPLYLAEHLSRLIRSLKELRIAWEPLQDIDWPQLLGELLQRNGLLSSLAALKIVVTRGIALPLGLPEGIQPTVFVQARPYQPPSPDLYARGWRLHICRSGYAPPLAGHKSLNYLFYLAARQQAIDAEADEAVILDAHGRIAETAAGTLLIRSNETWWSPNSPFQLPGITIQSIRRLFEKRGLTVESHGAAIEDLTRAQTVWVLNSLLGIMPVRSVDGHELPLPAVELAARWRDELFADSKAAC
jgi:branched-chain amino acid aminotransferase